MSYLSPTKRSGPKPAKLDTPEKIYLTAGEAILELNRVCKEANESIKFEQALRAYWLDIAEELGEALKEAAEENNSLREQLKTHEMLKKEVIELRERLSKMKSKAQLEREEGYKMERQKRKR